MSDGRTLPIPGAKADGAEMDAFNAARDARMLRERLAFAALQGGSVPTAPQLAALYAYITAGETTP